jgi:hypothetical protein
MQDTNPRKPIFYYSLRGATWNPNGDYAFAPDGARFTRGLIAACRIPSAMPNTGVS